MRKIFVPIAFLISAFTFTANAQDNAEAGKLSAVLQSYYNVKNALVEGDQTLAAESATAFIKNLNGISYKTIAEGNVTTLLKDAGTISDAKSLEKQRAVFANFSTNMTAVAKNLKLSDQPVYLQYCPMKKASWLSNEQAIKNPYYGSSMLSCGKVMDTIK